VRSSADRPQGGSAAWLAVAALLLLPALALFGQALGPRLLAWEPALWMTEPWRWWSAAWIHLSPLHLGANGAGAALVAALGVAARVPPRAALAWALAWPATQLGLLAMPDITGYGGLSGVLHAGVAVVAVVLVRRSGQGERRVGLAIAAVLTLKLLIEAPWRAAVIHPVGWDIAVAPLAHASGALAGAGLAWLLCRPVARTGQHLPPTRSPADR
jgi:rhomboid family GlyGly-CTERM serine protease